MSMRTRILGMVDVIMRVPPLFVIDEILKISMGLPSFSSNGSTNSTGVFSGSSGTIVMPDILVSNSSSTTSLSLQNGGNYTDNGTTYPAILDAILANVSAATASGGGGAAIDASDYFRVLSLTTLKFFACLLGELEMCLFM